MAVYCSLMSVLFFCSVGVISVIFCDTAIDLCKGVCLENCYLIISIYHRTVEKLCAMSHSVKIFPVFVSSSRGTLLPKSVAPISGMLNISNLVVSSISPLQEVCSLGC